MNFPWSLEQLIEDAKPFEGTDMGTHLQALRDTIKVAYWDGRSGLANRLAIEHQQLTADPPKEEGEEDV